VRNGGAMDGGYVAQQGPSVDADSPRYTSQARTKEDVFFQQIPKIDGGAVLRTDIFRAEHKQFLSRASDKLRRKLFSGEASPLCFQ
jgi:hypothetical protein